MRFNGELSFCSDYTCKFVEPGTYYVGVRVTDTAGNTSDWSYKDFRVTADEVKRTPLAPLNVTAGTDRFYIEPLVPEFDSYTRQQICHDFIDYWKERYDLTEEMMNDYLDHILDYAQVEYYSVRSDWDKNDQYHRLHRQRRAHLTQFTTTRCR